MREMIQPAQTDVRNYGIDGLRIVSMLPVTFGVYILHLQENVFQLLFKSGGFTPFVKLPAPLIAVAVLLSAVAIFAILGVVDLLRAWVFRKLKLKQRLLRLEEKWIGKLWD